MRKCIEPGYTDTPCLLETGHICTVIECPFYQLKNLEKELAYKDIRIAKLEGTLRGIAQGLQDDPAFGPAVTTIEVLLKEAPNV